ncbi:MAG: hypothetical protein WD535_04995, partial [Thermaerobacterales bacterium]
MSKLDGSRLAPIVNDTRRDLAARRRALPEAVLAERARKAVQQDPRRDLLTAVGRAARPGLIAEIKRGSPAAGAFGQGLDPVALARSYTAGGAAAISVVTERHHFGGDPADLGRVRDAAPLPVL